MEGISAHDDPPGRRGMLRRGWRGWRDCWGDPPGGRGDPGDV